MTNAEMTNREAYITSLKQRLERCNAAIARPAPGGSTQSALRAEREEMLARLRNLESGGPS